MTKKESHKKAQPDRVVDPSDKAWVQFRLPAKYLSGTHGKDGESLVDEHESHGGSTPLLVFINTGSGGHVGEQLASYFKEALGKAQVFEVGKECKPQDVIQRIWENFEKAKKQGDAEAEKTQASIRLIACGGDGTIAWVLNSVRQLSLSPCPPAAVIPLGTGNGLSINFGWGKTMRANWIASNKRMLQELKGVAEAEIRSIDLWHIHFEADRCLYMEDDIPAALHIKEHKGLENGTTQSRSIQSDNSESLAQMAGEFCYYFTFGLDAEGAYRFDHLRKTKPHLTKKRKINIFWYMWFIVRTGWFCGASPLNEKIVRLQIKDKNGEWHDIPVANSIRALIIINLQTYSGGRDVWGLKDLRPEEGRNKGFVNPIFDDGLLEVVGLEGGWKSWAALSGIRKDLHGRRIAQASELKITYHSPKEKKGVAMRLDGEPWWQPLPDTEGDNVEVHIRHSGKANMLLNTSKLPGVTKKMLHIAQREKKLSQPSDV